MSLNLTSLRVVWWMVILVILGLFGVLGAAWWAASTPGI